MSFASPERLIWLLIAIPIIGFYLLKTRLRSRQVATLLFWDQLFDEKRQRSLWQKLRHWLSLLLQLILVGLLCLALGDPLWESQTHSGQELILIIDNSASMQATDPTSGETRLETAMDRAMDVAQGLRQGDKIALITAGSRVHVVVGMTDFAPAIEDALATIQPTDGPTRIDESIEAARRLSSDPLRRRVVVFSDACLPQRKPITSANDLRWVQVGTSQSNVALTTFQVRRSTVDPIGYALWIEVQNLSGTTAETQLVLKLDNSLVDVIPISLGADEVWRKTIDGTSRTGGVLNASLKFDPGHRDGLAVDNVAWAIVPPRPMIPVTLVSSQDQGSSRHSANDSSEDAEAFYLRRVLEAIPLVELTIADPQWAMESGDSLDGLTVFSGITPPRLPSGPTLLIGVAEDGPRVENDGKSVVSWKVGEAIEAPLIAKQNSDSQLLRHVRLQNVVLAGGRDLDVNALIGEATTLLETAEGARVLVTIDRVPSGRDSGDQASGRVMILSADLANSDLPLRIAFPVMMTNAMNWFFHHSGEMNPALATGQVVSVPWDLAEDSSDHAVLMDPTGEERQVSINQKMASMGPLETAGVYGLFSPDSLPERNSSTQQNDQAPVVSPIQWSTQSSDIPINLLAVNLCDAEESDLRLPTLTPQAEGDLPRGGASPWFYLTLLAIGLVLGEWALFHRRVIA